jgi:hypothetical protein
MFTYEHTEEIDKVIFSYVDRAERGDAKNLEDLVKLKSKPLEIGFQDDRIKLEDINGKVIELENVALFSLHYSVCT